MSSKTTECSLAYYAMHRKSHRSFPRGTIYVSLLP